MLGAINEIATVVKEIGQRQEFGLSRHRAEYGERPALREWPYLGPAETPKTDG
jgi:hypothetical protein